MSAFFFDRFAAAAGVASAARGDVVIEQMLASAGDGVRIEAEEFGQNAIAAVA
jgi:hypothetical protein